MDNKANVKIELPQGYFCGGNCSDCRYFEYRNTDSNGRGYCNWYGTHYYPSERQGCQSYQRF